MDSKRKRARTGSAGTMTVVTFALGGLIASLINVGAVGSVSAETGVHSAPAEAHAAFIASIDRARAAAGMPPYVTHPLLETLAQAHADYMIRSGRFSHFGPDGLSARHRILNAGFPGHRAGENYVSRRTADEAVQWLLDDPPHRNNVLHTYYNAHGVGVARTQWGAWLFVQDLGFDPDATVPTRGAVEPPEAAPPVAEVPNDSLPPDPAASEAPEASDPNSTGVTEAPISDAGAQPSSNEPAEPGSAVPSAPALEGAEAEGGSWAGAAAPAAAAELAVTEADAALAATAADAAIAEAAAAAALAETEAATALAETAAAALAETAADAPVPDTSGLVDSASVESAALQPSVESMAVAEVRPYYGFNDWREDGRDMGMRSAAVLTAPSGAPAPIVIDSSAVASVAPSDAGWIIAVISSLIVVLVITRFSGRP